LNHEWLLEMFAFAHFASLFLPAFNFYIFCAPDYVRPVMQVGITSPCPSPRPFPCPSLTFYLKVLGFPVRIEEQLLGSEGLDNPNYRQTDEEAGSFLRSGEATLARTEDIETISNEQIYEEPIYDEPSIGLIDV
jgi:hypothetical protein